MELLAASTDDSWIVGVVGGAVWAVYFLGWLCLPLYRLLWTKRKGSLNAKPKVDTSMVAPPGGREKVKRVSLPSHRRDAIVFAIVGSLAIIVTLVVLVVDPHSKWLGWLALLDVALVVLHIPWSKRFMSFRNHKVERGSVLPGDDSLLK
jgi:hypothetical protein